MTELLAVDAVPYLECFGDPGDVRKPVRDGFGAGIELDVAGCGDDLTWDHATLL